MQRHSGGPRGGVEVVLLRHWGSMGPASGQRGACLGRAWGSAFRAALWLR